MDDEGPSALAEFLSALFATGNPTYMVLLVIGFCGGYGLAYWRAQERRPLKQERHRARKVAQNHYADAPKSLHASQHRERAM